MPLGSVASTTVVAGAGFLVASVGIFVVGVFVGTVAWMPMSFAVAVLSLLRILEVSRNFLVSSILVMAGSGCMAVFCLLGFSFPKRVLLFACCAGICAGAFWTLMRTAPNFQLR